MFEIACDVIQIVLLLGILWSCNSSRKTDIYSDKVLKLAEKIVSHAKEVIDYNQKLIDEIKKIKEK